MTNQVMHLRGRVAALSRSRTPDDADLVAARRELSFEMLAQHIQQVIEAVPSLSAEQRDHLARALGIAR